MLIQYIRNKNGNLRGVVVATGLDSIGYSLCNKKDRFLKDKGLHIATERAEVNRHFVIVGNTIQPMREIPHVVKPYLEKMIERARRYYK